MLASAPDLESPPQLAAGFADYRAHLLFGSAAPPPAAPRVEGDDSGGLSADERRFRTRHTIGEVGVALIPIGIGLEFVGVLGAFGSAFLGGDESGAVAALGLVVVGGVASIAGEVMLFDGAIGASQLVDVPTTVGWVGVALAVGAIPVEFLSPLAGSAMAIGGLVCGAVQLGSSGHAGREQGLIGDLWVLPTSNGIRLAGVF